MEPKVTIVVTYKITIRNLLVSKIARVTSWFSDDACIWCWNNLFEGPVWIRQDWRCRNGRSV